MAGFWASSELIREYRAHCLRCKAQGVTPMECEDFYNATVNGQRILEASDKLDSSLVNTLPTAASTAPANVPGGTGQAGRQDGQKF